LVRPIARRGTFGPDLATQYEHFKLQS